MKVAQEHTTIIDGKESLNIGQAADYLGISRTAFNNVLKRNPQIKRRRLAYGNERYIWVEDLDRLRQGQIVNDEE